MPYKYFISYKAFESFNAEPEYPLLEMGSPVNEGLFDKLGSMFSKLTELFKNPEKLIKSVQASVTEAGDKAKKFLPKPVKINDTVLITMGDGKNSALDFSIAFTKICDLPDGSGLFQITGTTSPTMLKALAGSNKEEDLTKNTVMAMISPQGFQKGEPATMKLLKNVLPNGQDYITKSLFTGAVPDADVEKMLVKVK